MSIADKLLSVKQSKDAIKAAIESKGIVVGDKPFSEYASLVDQIQGETIVILPPKFLSAVIPEDGLSVILTFDKDISVEDLVLTIYRGYTYEVLGNKLILTVENVIYKDDEITLEYLSGIQYLDAFNVIVDNQSTVNAPVADVALSMFKEGDVGVYYDFNDLTTLYQDTLMINPVTQVGQTVAAWKDKSGTGWDTIQPTVSRQAKVALDEETGSRYIQFDGTDDQIDQIIGKTFDVSRGITIIIASDYKTTATYARLHVGVYQSGGWGFAIKGISNTINGGITSSVTSPTATSGWNFETGSLSVNTSVPTKDCYILTGNSFSVKLTANNGYSGTKSVTSAIGWNLTNFYMGINNKNVYKVLVINRVLTDEECEAVRNQFNTALGV